MNRCHVLRDLTLIAETGGLFFCLMSDSCCSSSSAETDHGSGERRRFGGVPVVKEHRLVGNITEKDVLTWFIEFRGAERCSMREIQENSTMCTAQGPILFAR